MALDQETKNFINDSQMYFYEEFTKQINNLVVIPLNEKFQYLYNRFDDVEKRLERIESELNIMGKDTKLIPDVFKMLETDGVDIANLATRVDKLDS